MLRKLIITTIVVSFLFMLGGVITSIDGVLPGLLANTTISGFASATVPDILELFGDIRAIPANTTNPNPWDFPATTDLDFGTLVYEEELGALRGENYFVALMIPVSSGRKFEITQTGSSLGPGAFPDNRYVVTPDYSAADAWDESDPLATAQGSMPTGAFLGAPTTAAGTNNVYTSDTGGTTKIIRGWLSIPLKPLDEDFPFNYAQGYDVSGVGQGAIQRYTGWEQLSLGDAEPGTYTGTVTFTLSLVP